MKSFSLKSRWIAPSRALFPSLSPQDKLKFHDKVEFPSGYSPPNFYNQLLIYSLEIFKQVSKFFFFFFRKENSRPLFFFFSLVRARNNLAPQITPSFHPNWITIAIHIHPIDVYPTIIEIFDPVFFFFFDGSRRGATPGYSLNFIVYLLITGRWALGAMYRTAHTKRGRGRKKKKKNPR